MKKVVLSVCFVLLLLSLSSFAFAEETLGAGESGFYGAFGYIGAQLHYDEEVLHDKDTGWLNGFSGELRFDGSAHLPIFARLDAYRITSSNAKYTGATQSGIPLMLTVPEDIRKGELDLGYKIWNPAHFSLAPYIGIGYRDWDRNEDKLPFQYEEDYTWWYGVLGAEAKYRAAERLLIGLDAAMLVPFSPKMKTNIAGLIPTTTFNLKSRVGARVQLPTSYDIYKGEKSKVFAFLTPFYERWNVGQSPEIEGFFEPASHTNLYGIKVGLGVGY